MTAAGLGCHFCLGHTLQNSKLRVWLALLHISRTVDYCGRMHAQLLTPSKVKLHNLGIQSTHDERSSTTAAQQQQQHRSGGDVGGPEEAPLVAPATLPFLVCITKSHGAAWKKGCQVCHMKKNATCTLTTSHTKQRHIMMSVAQLLYTAAQQQQHSSGGDVGEPEEAPLVAPVTCPFSFASPNSTERLPHRGVASVQTKVEG